MFCLLGYKASCQQMTEQVHLSQSKTNGVKKIIKVKTDLELSQTLMK